MNNTFDLDLYNYSFWVVLDIPTKDKCHLVDTKKDILDLQRKNITLLLLRTIVNLHTRSLNISYNKLSFLPSIHTLRILHCDNCELRYLPTSMPNMTDLSCANNLLTYLPKYKQLIKCNCSNNFISKIDISAYSNLRVLNCSSNLITDLPNTKYTITATNCPILTIYNNPAAYKRSGVIKNGKFVWVVDNLSSKYVLINWQTAKTSLTPSYKFTKKVFKFLFYA